MRRNVLLLCMSDLRSGDLNYYSYENNYYQCVSQLEAGSKTVIDLICNDSPERRQALSIIVFNTEETLNDNDLIKQFGMRGLDDTLISNEYRFYKKRIIDYVEGKNEENNAKFIVTKEQIGDDNLIKLIDDELINIFDGLNENSGYMKESGAVDYQKIQSDILKRVDDYLKDMYATEEDIRFINDISIINGKNDGQSSNILELNSLIDRISEELKMWTIDTLDDLKSAEYNMASLNILEKSLEEIKKDDDSPTFQMLLGYQSSYRKLRMMMQLKMVELNEKISGIQNDIPEAYASTDYVEDSWFNAYLNRLRDVTYKLKTELEHTKGQYRNKVRSFIKHEIWEVFIDANVNKKPKNIDISFESCLISHGIEEQLDFIDELLKNEGYDEYNIYFDTQGGARDNVIMMSAVMEMFKSHIAQDNKKSLQIETFATNYSFGNMINRVYSNKEKYNSFDLVGGINELSRYLKPLRLEKYINNSVKPELLKYNELTYIIEIVDKSNKLFKTLRDFSDRLYLCNIDGIEKLIEDINSMLNGTDGIISRIEECSKSEELGNKEVLSTLKILKNIFVEINYILISPVKGKESGVSLPRLILLCKNKDMLQQAITLAAERSAQFFIDKGIVTIPANCKIGNTPVAFQKPFRPSFKKYWVNSLPKLAQGEDTEIDKYVNSAIQGSKVLSIGGKKYNSYIQSKKAMDKLIEKIDQYFENNRLKNSYFNITPQSFEKMYKWIVKTQMSAKDDSYCYFMTTKGFSNRWHDISGINNQYDLNIDKLIDSEQIGEQELLEDWIIFYMFRLYYDLKSKRNDINHADFKGEDIGSLRGRINHYIELLMYFE